MPWMTKSSPSSCVWPGRTRAGATSASWASAGSSVWPSRRPACATCCAVTAFAGTAGIWAIVVRVPSSTSRQHARVRLLPCRHGHAAPALCAVLYRPRASYSLLGWRTAHPVGTWVTQQARNLAATLEDQGRAIRFLVRDRDAKFVGPFDEVMRSIGARVILTPVRSPRANAVAERFVRTARAECLDWLLIRGERHLNRVLREFVEHYNNQRPHRGIDLEVPVAYTTFREFTSVDGVQRADRLGGRSTSTASPRSFAFAPRMQGSARCRRVTDLNVDHSSPVQTRFNSWIIGFIPSNSSNREVAPFTAVGYFRARPALRKGLIFAPTGAPPQRTAFSSW